jgi:hypothetical protein
MLVGRATGGANEHICRYHESCESHLKTRDGTTAVAQSSARYSATV